MTVGPELWIEGIGAFRGYVGGAEIDLGPPKQQSAFAVLALSAGTVVSRAELIQAVWGEAAPRTAAGGLHTYVSALRRALGPREGVLVTGRAGYGLIIDRVMFDVTRAEDLTHRARTAPRDHAALAAYGSALDSWPPGTLLAGVTGPFVERARDRLDGLRLRLVVEHAELVPPELLPEAAGRLLAEIPAHPLDERLRCTLMTVLHHSGRTGEALAQYDDLRRVLSADLGISPSPATEAVYGEILADNRRRAVAPVTGGPAGPAQLPHDSDVFVGRDAELLTVLRGAAGDAEPRRRIVLVVGVGGIGKTALAVRAGHLLRDSYPDGQIHLDLRGFDPARAALTAETALRFLLTSVGVRQVTGTHEERVALWRSRVAGRRFLVLLDNAESAAQIEELLPGTPTCLVLVTSRNRLSGMVVRHGARRITLGPLSEPESLHLLGITIGADRVRAEPDSARRLAALCDRSPFALQIAAEQAGSAPATRLEELAGQLEDIRHRLDALQLADDPLCSVRGVLSWSVAALSEAEAQAFRLLGVLPGTSVTPRVAAALVGTGVVRGADLLGRLAELSLLDQEGERFRIHDLTHAYAVELARELTPADREAALSRVLSWYRLTLLTRNEVGVVARGFPAEAPYSEVPPTVFVQERDFLRWCAAERQNLVALVGAAHRHGLHGPTWHLVSLIFEYFYMAGQPLEWLEVLRLAYRSAEVSGNDVGRAIMDGHRGLAYSRLGHTGTAVRHLNRGLALVTAPDQGRYRVMLLIVLALALLEAKDYGAVPGPAAEALDLARAVGIDYYLASIHAVLCRLHAETGRGTEALRYGPSGLEYARRCHSPMLQAHLLLGIGLARSGLGQLADAERSYREALRISQEAGDRYHEGHALFGLARVGGREPAAAAALARRALARFEELHADEVADVRVFLADGAGARP
ncbi:BTAD domain-containing putative transcriptional regulator [Actinoplanes sp. NPDC051494]|uniref:AfsR/SARP family transcriptional regulator n=1 Tax=Actinoplanes sp. NPDC051494 TaxID=3363907 RepID=UPI0037AC29A5